MLEPVLKVKLNPDLNRIKRYIPESQFAKLERQSYVQLELAMSNAEFERYQDGLISTFNKYGLISHKDELLYIIFTEDEILVNQIEDDKLKYDDLQKAIDVSKFLLAIKNAKDNPLFQIGIKENVGTVFKPKTNSHFIQNDEISKWMCQLIYDAIEEQKFPLHIFGEVFFLNVFGINPNEKTHIAFESLNATSKLKNKSHTVFRKKRYAQFCFEIIRYLEIHTNLKTPIGVKITDTQANFLFDILETLTYLNRDKIQSEPKDYINSMIRNSLL